MTIGTDQPLIEVRLNDLTARRAAIPDDDQLPASTTRGELAVIQQQRAELDRRIAAIHASTAAVATLGSAEDDERGLEYLTAWRATLSAELMAIKSPIRDKLTMGRSINLTLSLKCIDFGPQRALKDQNYDLTTLKLGELMRAAGYQPVGADLDRNFGGTMPWFGSLPEVERRIATLGEQRAKAQAALEAALMTDDERDARDAEDKALRDAFNAMHVKVSADGSGLVAYTKDGLVLDASQMTELQRRAFARMDAMYRR